MDKSELDALVAYLQGLGVRPAAAADCRGDAMSPIWGHAIGVSHRPDHAGLRRHLALGLAAASQEGIRRVGATADA